MVRCHSQRFETSNAAAPSRQCTNRQREANERRWGQIGRERRTSGGGDGDRDGDEDGDGDEGRAGCVCIVKTNNLGLGIRLWRAVYTYTSDAPGPGPAVLRHREGNLYHAVEHILLGEGERYCLGRTTGALTVCR